MEARRRIRGQRKDGTSFPAEAGISKMVLGGEMFFTAFLRDVTERLEAQELLNLQAAALHTAANGIASTDTEGVMQGVNPAFTGLTGYSSEDAVGQNPRVLKSDKHDRAFYKGMWDTIKSGQVWQGELINQRKDGSLYTEEMTITPVPNEDGELVHFVAIKQDITERKRLEMELERANERMSIELNFAREIQLSMLPLIFPAFPTREEVGVYARLESAREVGGDFYDFYFLDDDHLCFVIADVSGKGAPGALLMAVSKTLIKSRAADDHEPASILTHVNDELSRDNESAMFVTAFLGILNVKTGELWYTNAGHNPPYVKRRGGKVEKVDAFHGPVVGALSGMTYKCDQMVLNPKDIIVLYTDGVTEAMDESEALFSDERFEALLHGEGLISPETVIDGTVAAVRLHQGEAEQADDITILAVQYKGRIEQDGTNLRLIIKNRLEELSVVEEQFHEFAQQNDIPDGARQKMSIVLDDLLNNVVNYAYQDEDEHEIEVHIELSGKRLVATIQDDGVPFNPFGLETPDVSGSVGEREIGGLGIHLVRSMMDEYLYQRQINKNVVTLVKMIDR
jgi:sigma-B regulation protein RsbU (phosphoserine phosphatase)